MTSELQSLIHRLNLSHADVLLLAREAAQDAKIRSVEHLTTAQADRLETLLMIIAAIPANVDSIDRNFWRKSPTHASAA